MLSEAGQGGEVQENRLWTHNFHPKQHNGGATKAQDQCEEDLHGRRINAMHGGQPNKNTEDSGTGVPPCFPMASIEHDRRINIYTCRSSYLVGSLPVPEPVFYLNPQNVHG